MDIIELIDRMGQRRLERWHIAGPPRPFDWRMLVGALFFTGYYYLVYLLLQHTVPAVNAPLVRDAMLVLGPVVGAIGAALFRTDVRDEISATNTGTAFRAMGTQAKATTAAIAATDNSGGAAKGAQEVADAAADRAAEITTSKGLGNVADD